MGAEDTKIQLMRHRVLALGLAAMALCTSVNAQTGKKGTDEFRVTAGYTFGLTEGAGGAVSLTPEYGHYFSDQFYFGMGTGITMDDSFESVAIPLFARGEVNFPTSGSITPYVSLAVGYDINTEGDNSVARINPSVGVKVPIAKNTLFNLGFGYTRTIVKGGGGDFLGFTAGLNFDTRGKGFSNFLKKLNHTLELEAYTNFGPDNKGDNACHSSKTFGLRYTPMAKVAENLSVGPSIGLGRSNLKEDWGDENKIYLLVMARGRYDFNQVQVFDKVHPFAQLEVGYNAFGGIDYAGIISVNPAVGLSMPVGSKNALDLSLGYYTLSNGMSGYLGHPLRIALGYRF